MKYGFLFGAGAEAGYGLPSGGEFALEIFRRDQSNSKNNFKEMRNKVDSMTTYANSWLPKDYKDKNISCFGKSVFLNIIKDTVEHNRNSIIGKLNNFDTIAEKVVRSMANEGVFVKETIEQLLGRNIGNIHYGQDISFIDEFKQGNELFNSSYFSALLMLYKNKKLDTQNQRNELGKILISIIQLHIGALSENLTRKINDGVFEKKDDEIDLFDDLGEIIQLNYSAAGLQGMEYLLEQRIDECETESGVCLSFAQRIIREIYSVVLDYKSLIDANWHYLYSPSSDWAKFCKICIFLLNVRDYITEMAETVEIGERRGYYHMVKEAADSGKFELSAVATTNYNNFIEEILDTEIAYLNGSTEIWYDPYLNRMGSREELDTDEHHILVPLLFTQSGTKPMTAIEMSEKYVETYHKWKEADKIVVVGFGFGVDDEHINGILRTLIDRYDKKIVVITLKSNKLNKECADEISIKLKIEKKTNISVVQVVKDGMLDNGGGESWVDFLDVN